jgi:predicted nucleic acid-binding protein
MFAEGWPSGGPQRVLSPEELNALLADAADFRALDPRRGPLPAVVDTGFIRTGLQDQLKKGKVPASVWSAQDGDLRLFMEYDTLVETQEKLPKFAGQLGVTVSELRRILNQDWLPNIEVIRLPPGLRELDSRALLVRDRDTDDFPAAALATLLSPCLLLTRDKDFAALGVRTETQGRDGVLAVIAIKVGDVQLQAALAVPALPFRIAGATMSWATEKIGNYAWVILGLVVAGGAYWYLKQPPERRETIKKAAASIGTYVMNEYNVAAGDVYQARLTLRASMVPKPQDRTPVSAIIRELALSSESLSAAQLAELLDPTVRPSVADIRAFLRAYDNTVFKQVRRGGFVLGVHYQLRG